MGITFRQQHLMKLLRRSVVAWFLLIGSIAVASQYHLGSLSLALEQSLMRQLLGHWQIADSSLDAEGKWLPGPGADWHFYPILNGHAVQDDWTAPPLSQPAPASGRQYGTNIRIYNTKKSQWEMAWASSKGQQVDTFVATETDTAIIMTGLFNGQHSKITFYDIKANSFLWKLEYQQSDNSWQAVYRIKASRQHP